MAFNETMLKHSEPDALMKSFAHSGDVENAEELLRWMVQHDHDVSTATLNLLIHACTQAKDLDGAEMFLEGMESSPIEPDVVSYNSVINACAAEGHATRAEGWLEHMITRGLAPNEVTFGTICKAFARQGNVKAVRDIMTNLETAGYTLNEYFYASLISACGTAEPPDVAQAEAAFEELCAKGVKVQSVRKALVRAVGAARASELMHEHDGGRIVVPPPVPDARPRRRRGKMSGA